MSKVNCDLIIEDLEKAPPLSAGQLKNSLGGYCALGWLYRCAGVRFYEHGGVGIRGQDKLHERYGDISHLCVGNMPGYDKSKDLVPDRTLSTRIIQANDAAKSKKVRNQKVINLVKRLCGYTT